MANYKQIPVQLTEEIIETLDELAFEKAIKTKTRPSRAEIIRIAVNEFLEKKKKI